MNPQLVTQINEMVEQLPDHIQSALGSFDWLNTVREVGVKYRLAGDQLDRFIIETAMVIAGAEDPGLYGANLKNHVVVSDEMVMKIIDDITVRILDPLDTEIARLTEGLTANELREALTANTPALPELVADEYYPDGVNMPDGMEWKPEPATADDTATDITFTVPTVSSVQKQHDVYHEPLE